MGVKVLGICNLVGICRSGQTLLSNPDKFSGIIKRGKGMSGSWHCREEVRRLVDDQPQTQTSLSGKSF